MQESLKKIVQKISFFTTKPDVDWRRMFTILILVAVVSLGWNVYFYFVVQRQIAESEIVMKNKVGTSGAREDEVQEVVNQYEKRKADQTSLITNKSFKLEDPSVL
ncbi:MAG: hypothetical protein FGM57_02325 [Candidatus Taylorbacteria bacterium]|nr:hypothetical protein [Candidatus Taylorbacteria bacterium]